MEAPKGVQTAEEFLVDLGEEVAKCAKLLEQDATDAEASRKGWFSMPIGLHLISRP